MSRAGAETWTERNRRAFVVRAHREAYGQWCPGWKRAPHEASDIVADHIVPVAAGGREDGPLQALCRSCNARKRNHVDADASTPFVRSRDWLGQDENTERRGGPGGGSVP